MKNDRSVTNKTRILYPHLSKVCTLTYFLLDGNRIRTRIHNRIIRRRMEKPRAIVSRSWKILFLSCQSLTVSQFAVRGRVGAKSKGGGRIFLIIYITPVSQSQSQLLISWGYRLWLGTSKKFYYQLNAMSISGWVTIPSRDGVAHIKR